MHNAIRLLDAYRHTVPSFNDDIQGTAVVVLAGILAAMRSLGRNLRDQRLVLAGAAGIGIARLVGQAMRADGASPEDVRTRIVMTDSRGLVFEDRNHLDVDKQWFALPVDALARYGFTSAPGYDLETVIRRTSPVLGQAVILIVVMPPPCQTGSRLAPGPEPARHHKWTTRSGRQYTTGPTTYPI